LEQLELYPAIVAQYQKFDFRLERCLMTKQTLTALQSLQHRSDKFIDVPVDIGEIDAIWFSRPSGAGVTAWEIRLVSSTPLSLLEKISDSATVEERALLMEEMEKRLLNMITTRRQAIEEIIAENSGAENDDEETEESEEK
jgi:hypothetical protein